MPSVGVQLETLEAAPLASGRISRRARFKESGSIGNAGEPGERWQVGRGASANSHLDDAIVRDHGEIDPLTVILHVEARLVVLTREDPPAGHEYERRVGVAARDVNAALAAALPACPLNSHPVGCVLTRYTDLRGCCERADLLQADQADSGDRLSIHELRLEPRREVARHHSGIDAKVDENPTPNDPLDDWKAHEAIIGVFGAREFDVAVTLPLIWSYPGESTGSPREKDASLAQATMLSLGPGVREGACAGFADTLKQP